MTPASWILLADEVTRSTFEWGRIQSNTDWILPIGACLAILLFVRYMYHRDAVELRPVVGWLLTALRTAAFLGLLILFLQPHWRSEREKVDNSRALLLIDTSMSMGQTDSESPVAVGAASAVGAAVELPPQQSPTREQQVAALLAETNFLARLRKTHDVAVFQFGEELGRMISLGKEQPRAAVEDDAAAAANSPGAQAADGNVGAKIAEKPVDWAKLLSPTGKETRLGQALRQLIHDERGPPVSGVILLSDGGQNAGISPDAAVQLAQEAKIPVFTVGLGSDRQPAHVRVSDLVVPTRAYPGDHYTVTGYIQAQGMAGKVVAVQVLSRPAGEAANAARQGTGDVIESQQITLGGDGEVLPVKFDLTPDAAGRRTIVFRIQGAEGERLAADRFREADIEIVDRKNHVLLLAGGPAREYQFLRSQLFRDRSMAVDILLQTAQPGISQDAKKILDDFPTTREEMYDYDCIVAFDPNWQALNAAQVELLEGWVAEQGGGLIVVAGPVYAGKGVNGWVQDPVMTPVRNLYPVEFPRRLAAVETTTYTTKEPWTLDFTREGLEADFLWLGDAATAAKTAWASFPGVYSYCPVRGAKPGATVFARFSDPRAGQGGQQPPYFAGQFYGSGSVFYMGSGEMWRLRSVDDTYFEQFYTKLIRHVSQGRLLRGSARGVLLVGQDRYMVGNSVEVRAQLTNARLEPLNMPSVNLEVVQPAGAVQTVALRPDPGRVGTYFGQFPVLQEGTYRLELPVPESDNERLTRRIQVKVPDLERENPRRNDALLSAIAKNTGGKYYVGINAMLVNEGPDALTAQLKDQTTTVILPVAPNPQEEETWLRRMMIALCGLLCLEWLIRRLSKLA